ncbi:hypothetical protein [Micromonospora sp. NPDC004704]
MGNGWAYPILRSPDLTRVVGAARELLALTNPPPALVDHTAHTRTHEAARYLPALPSARLFVDVPPHLVEPARKALTPTLGESELADVRPDGTLWLMSRFTPELVAALQRLPDLPVEVASEEQPQDGPEEAFLSLVGRDRGRIYYWHGGWPAVPELDLSPSVNSGEAEIQVTIHSADIWEIHPAPDHGLYVHVGHGQRRRAQWLANSIGLDIIGPMELKDVS